jgi:2-polyprenyl-3-methyl-5-hydroxy-6-metoxy-1,4-benzoquinol methylase
MSLKYFEQFKQLFFKEAAIFKSNFNNVESEFGDNWKQEFDLHLMKQFADNEENYINAIKGYSRFSIDAMRLQKRFNKKLKYEDVSYDEACEKVYLNEEYMFKLYLPGIFVSHFLWRHHHRQLMFYKENFLPLIEKSSDQRFYDVGTGTGFYSVQFIRHNPKAEGTGIDLSPYSRKFTANMIKAWGFENNFTSCDKNIIEESFEPFPFVQTIEVLEHLSDPQLFLNNLRKLLKKGGYGFLTAALTAPNADHIYLYWTPEEVIQQIEKAGFSVIKYCEDIAYEAEEGEHVPKLAAFIVQ